MLHIDYSARQENILKMNDGDDWQEVGEETRQAADTGMNEIFDPVPSLQCNDLFVRCLCVFFIPVYVRVL